MLESLRRYLPLLILLAVAVGGFVLIAFTGNLDTLAARLAELPAEVSIILFKLTLAIGGGWLAVQGSKWMDRRNNIDFAKVYKGWPPSSKADYHGKRLLAIAVVMAACLL